MIVGDITSNTITFVHTISPTPNDPTDHVALEVAIANRKKTTGTMILRIRIAVFRIFGSFFCSR